MDVRNDKQNLINESHFDYPCSPTQENISDDEDVERELEVMLYSQIHHEATISGSSDMQSDILIQDLNNGGGNEKYSGTGLSVISKQSVPCQSSKNRPTCRRSEFNKVGRTKASRYYDIHGPPINRQIVKHLPDDKCSRPSSDNSKDLGISELNSSSAPSNKKKCVALDKTKKFISNLKELNVEEPILSPSVGCLSSSPVMVIGESTVNLQKTACPKVISETIAQAEIPEVVSSMLDDESVSVDDHHLIATRASQASKSHESGWSVGMSWFDMSSSHFEVESVDSESLCSFPAVENSAPTEIPADTPVSQIGEHVLNISTGTCSNRDEKESPDKSEESRYALQLKQVPCKEGLPDNSCMNIDCDSEEDSVIEVHVPAKAVPVVDVSDGENPMESKALKDTQKKHVGSDNDILFICAHRKRKADSFHEIVISDDDGKEAPVVKNVNNNFMSNLNNAKQRKMKSKNKIEAQTASLSKKRFVGESDKLNLWFNDPIKASRIFDHHRLLKKMSDDPQLWKLSALDRLSKPFSPRGPKCVNCKQFGHYVKFCPEPHKIIKCFMCGLAGHKDTRCPKKMCLRCGKPSNIFMDVCSKCSFQKSICQICQSSGHSWKVCPDMWRRYHLTTLPGEIIQAKDPQHQSVHALWCCNCGQKGHLSHECHCTQWKCESISPFVKSYCTPAEEELRQDGPNSATILLSQDDARILQTPEGTQFILGLSTVKNLTIHLNTGTENDNISIIGSTIDQEEARNRLMNWLAPRREILATQAGGKILQSSSCKSTTALNQETVCKDNSSASTPHNEDISSVSQSKKKNRQCLKNNPKSPQRNIAKSVQDCEQTVKPSQSDPVTTHDQIHAHSQLFSEANEGLNLDPCSTSHPLTSKKKKKKKTNPVPPANNQVNKKNFVAHKSFSTFVPGNPIQLKNHLFHSLQLFQNKTENVSDLYLNIMKLTQQSVLSRRDKQNLCYFNSRLNVALLGIHKVGPGRKHVKILENIFDYIGRVSKIPLKKFKSLKRQFLKNFFPIFSSEPRSDLKELMNEYHLSKSKSNSNLSDLSVNLTSSALSPHCQKNN